MDLSGLAAPNLPMGIILKNKTRLHFDNFFLGERASKPGDMKFLKAFREK